VRSQALRQNRSGRTKDQIQSRAAQKAADHEWIWQVFVAIYPQDIPFYVVISRSITKAMERVADSSSINRQVIRKALCVMKRALYGWLILLAGEEEPPLWLLFLIG
jgi:hypothetical protein